MRRSVDELTDDAITGDFRVWQRRRGHRYSLDDVATAWEAARARPDAGRCLDLGCGLGSVLLMVAWKLPEATLVGVEAQEVSFELVSRNVERNRLAPRVTLHHGDLRDEALVARLAEQPFDLITGTPPYRAPSDGPIPPDSQRAHARVELRGGVEDYLKTAGRLVASGGRVVVCAEARASERALAGAAAANLAPITQRDVVPRAGHKGPLFSVWTLARADEHDAPLVQVEDLVVRDQGGARTEQAHSLGWFFGLEPKLDEAPSP